jgi:prefoldin subunit 5
MKGSEVALVIETLHQQIQQIAELQVECTTLKQMVASMASIHTLAFPW